MKMQRATAVFFGLFLAAQVTTLSLHGSWTEYHDFEVTNTEPDRRARAPTERSVRLGYRVPNGDVTLVDNYLVGGLNFAQPWSSIVMVGNTVMGPSPGSTLRTTRATASRSCVRPG